MLKWETSYLLFSSSTAGFSSGLCHISIISGNKWLHLPLKCSPAVQPEIVLCGAHLHCFYCMCTCSLDELLKHRSLIFDIYTVRISFDALNNTVSCLLFKDRYKHRDIANKCLLPCSKGFYSLHQLVTDACPWSVMFRGVPSCQAILMSGICSAFTVCRMDVTFAKLYIFGRLLSNIENKYIILYLHLYLLLSMRVSPPLYTMSMICA